MLSRKKLSTPLCKIFLNAQMFIVNFSMDGSLISLGLAKVLEISRPKKTLLDDLQLIREDILLIARIFHREYSKMSIRFIC